MAHKKAAGSSKNGRDSQSKRLGIKVFGGQKVIPGNILVRQRGTKYTPGEGVKMGRDYTIYSVIEGILKFRVRKVQKYDGRIFLKTIVNVVKG